MDLKSTAESHEVVQARSLHMLRALAPAGRCPRIPRGYQTPYASSCRSFPSPPIHRVSSSVPRPSKSLLSLSLSPSSSVFQAKIYFGAQPHYQGLVYPPCQVMVGNSRQGEPTGLVTPILSCRMAWNSLLVPWLGTIGFTLEHRPVTTPHTAAGPSTASST